MYVGGGGWVCVCGGGGGGSFLNMIHFQLCKISDRFHFLEKDVI